MRPFTFGSLFSGIGGLDLGLERAGMQCLWQVEIDTYATQVLEHHWPNVARFRDVRTVGADTLIPVDLICGGFPCQDISHAGKRAGITGERSGLWSEMCRIIRELRPRYVLVENVSALLYRGLDRVLGDLASCGYDAEWQVLSAQAFGAPHLRERVFVVAYANSERRPLSSPGYHSAKQIVGGTRQNVSYSNGDRCGVGTDQQEHRQYEGTPDVGTDGTQEPMAYTGSARLQGRGQQTGLPETPPIPPTIFERRGGSRIERTRWWAAEPDVGRVAHGIPRRVDRLKGLGNAVVPQIAEYIGTCILQAERVST